MFNLNADPFEQVNLAHNQAYAGKLGELNDKLMGWIVKTGDSFTLPV